MSVNKNEFDICSRMKFRENYMSGNTVGLPLLVPPIEAPLCVLEKKCPRCKKMHESSKYKMCEKCRTYHQKKIKESRENKKSKDILNESPVDILSIIATTYSNIHDGTFHLSGTYGGRTISCVITIERGATQSRSASSSSEGDD